MDVGTVEGQWTPWAFGLSFDRTAGAQTVSAGLESYEVLWQVGEAESGRLVLQGEKDGVAARLVLEEMGTTMTKELTDWRTGLRLHQGSILAASEMQWFPADAAEGDTVVRIDEWLGLEADGSRCRPKSSRKAGSADAADVPRTAVRACVVQTTKGTTGTMHAYLADLFDMALGLNDAVYALPTTDTTIITVNDTGDDDSTAPLTTEESHALSSLADDLLFGLFPAAGGSCGGPVTLTVTRTGVGNVSASGSPYVIDWLSDEKTFMYASPPGDIELTATESDYYSFDCWVDGLYIWTDNPLELTLSDDKDMYVYFTTWALTMNVAGTEGASETTDPSAEQGDNFHLYKPREDLQIQVSAEPAVGFDCWESSDGTVEDALDKNNPGTFTMTQSCTVTAVMKPLYKITMEVYPSSEAGEVIVGPIHQKISGDKYFYEDTTATVRARPNTGYRFSEWDEDLDGVGDNPASLLMDENKTVKAVFEAALVSFAKAENQIYGFDDFTRPNSPWKSVALNYTDKAQAVITNGSPPATYFQPVTPENSPFPDASVLPAQASGSPQELTVAGHAVGYSGKIEATLNQGGQAVREMGVAVYQPATTPVLVALAHVSLDWEEIPDDNIEASAVQSYMNNVFGQAVVQFLVNDVGVVQIDYDSVGNGGDGDGRLDRLNNYVEWYYVRDRLPFLIDDIYDVFLCIVEDIDGGDVEVNGFADHQSGFMFVQMKNSADMPIESRHRTCAHEMGHAYADLSDIPEKGMDDENLMSYSHWYCPSTGVGYWPTTLRKPQWDKCHAE